MRGLDMEGYIPWQRTVFAGSIPAVRTAIYDRQEGINNASGQRCRAFFALTATSNAQLIRLNTLPSTGRNTGSSNRQTGDELELHYKLALREHFFYAHFACVELGRSCEFVVEPSANSVPVTKPL